MYEVFLIIAAEKRKVKMRQICKKASQKACFFCENVYNKNCD